MTRPYDEAQTRQQIIDEKLALAGWDVRDPSHVIQELDIELRKAGLFVGEERPDHPYEGHQFADYGLLLRGKPTAVVEAKRTSKDARLGQEQALRYAENLQKIHGGATPFVMYTNGYDIYHWESDHYPPVTVHGFPTPDDLEWLVQRRESRKPLSVELIDTDIAGRDYQIAAIRSLLEGGSFSSTGLHSEIRRWARSRNSCPRHRPGPSRASTRGPQTAAST